MSDIPYNFFSSSSSSSVAETKEYVHHKEVESSDSGRVSETNKISEKLGGDHQMNTERELEADTTRASEADAARDGKQVTENGHKPDAIGTSEPAASRKREPDPSQRTQSKNGTGNLGALGKMNISTNHTQAFGRGIVFEWSIRVFW